MQYIHNAANMIVIPNSLDMYNILINQIREEYNEDQTKIIFWTRLVPEQLLPPNNATTQESATIISSQQYCTRVNMSWVSPNLWLKWTNLESTIDSSLDLCHNYDQAGLILKESNSCSFHHS